MKGATDTQTLSEASHCFPWQPRDVLEAGGMERIVLTHIAPQTHTLCSLTHSYTDKKTNYIKE